MKKNKGITMISLVITIIVLLIVTSITIYNGVEQLGIKRVNSLYADIDSISTKVADYYLKNESLPIYENNKYVDSKEELEALFRRNGATENITNVNDGEDYYVLKLSKLDNLTLNYGEDYIDWEDTSTADDIQNLYIINSVTHQIYFPHGVRSGNDYYFARFPDENVVSPIELEDIDANWTIDITNISGNNIDEDNISIVADVKLSGLAENYDLNSLQYAWSDVDVESELANIEFTKFNVSNTSETDLIATISSKAISDKADNYYLYIKVMNKNGKYSYQKLSESCTFITKNLPIHYQRVEYIESTGTQYINTGVNPNPSTTKIETVFQLTNNTIVNQRIFGCRQNWQTVTTLCSIFWNNKKNAIRCDWVGNTITQAENFNLNTDIKIICQNNKVVINDIEYRGITVKSNDYLNIPIYINTFTDNGNFDSNQSHAYAKWKTFKIYDNDTLVRDFIPCYRKSDYKPGLYDLVTGEFYVNQGTGNDFIAGPNVE